MVVLPKKQLVYVFFLFCRFSFLGFRCLVVWLEIETHGQVLPQAFKDVGI